MKFCDHCTGEIEFTPNVGEEPHVRFNCQNVHWHFHLGCFEAWINHVWYPARTTGRYPNVREDRRRPWHGSCED